MHEEAPAGSEVALCLQDSTCDQVNTFDIHAAPQAWGILVRYKPERNAAFSPVEVAVDEIRNRRSTVDRFSLRPQRACGEGLRCQKRAGHAPGCWLLCPSPEDPDALFDSS